MGPIFYPPGALTNFPMEQAMTRVSLIVLSAALCALAGCGGGGGQGVERNGAVWAPAGPPRLDELTGSYILVISDVDMDATAFATAQLGSLDQAAEDQVTIFTLPIQEREEGTPWAQIAASSSAVGPPTAAAIAPNGRTAFIVETRGPAPAGAEAFGDLPPGRWLTAIDLSRPLEPQEAGRLDVGPEPMAVDVHPQGDLVAVVRRHAEDGNVIIVAPFSSGSGLGEEAYTWPLIDVPDAESASPSSIVWHPSGKYLAVTLPTRSQVVFFEFSREGDSGEWSLAPWGEPVTVGKYPYSGEFTPDGRFFITTDLQWGPDVEGFNIGAPPGRLTVVRLSEVESEAEEDVLVEHVIASVADVGISPEGLAISPDGKFVVTANLGQSFLPMDDPRLGGGSLTLLEMDRSTGRLRPVTEYPMQGMPEGICFDAAGRYVVVAQFRSLDPQVEDGELSFWRLNPGSGSQAPALEQGDFYLGVGRGPHGVLVAP